MKSVSELGTSPVPWFEKNGDVYCSEDVGVVYSMDCSYLSDADARLIAAAPDLFKALAGLVDFIDRECVPCGENACALMTVAHSALAKASGENEGIEE